MRGRGSNPESRKNLRPGNNKAVWAVFLSTGSGNVQVTTTMSMRKADRIRREFDNPHYFIAVTQQEA